MNVLPLERLQQSKSFLRAAQSRLDGGAPRVSHDSDLFDRILEKVDSNFRQIIHTSERTAHYSPAIEMPLTEGKGNSPDTKIYTQLPSVQAKTGLDWYKLFLASAFMKGEQVLNSAYLIALLLVLLTSICQQPTQAQSKEEIAKVTAITKREQTNYSALTFLADLALTKGDYKKAESCYKKMLDICKDDPGIGPKSARCALSMSQIALCENRLEKKADATKLCKDALAIIDGQTPDNNPVEGNYILIARRNCAQILGKEMPAPGPPKSPPLQLKCIPRAEIANLQAREIETKAFIDRAENPEEKAAEKKGTSEKKGQPEKKAQPEKKGQAKKKVHAIPHYMDLPYIKRLLYLANIYTLEKKYVEAEPTFEKVIGLYDRRSGKNSPELLTPLSNYGYMLMQSGKQKRAETILNRMQQIRTIAEQPHSLKPAKPAKI